MRNSALRAASLLATCASLSLVLSSAAWAQGRTIGGGEFVVDCGVAVPEDTIFDSAAPLKELCATIQADANCGLTLRLKDEAGVVIHSGLVWYNNAVTLCAKKVKSVTVQRAAAGGLATINWRADLTK